MPRHNQRPKRKEPRTFEALVQRQLTADQMARQLVREGKASRAILGLHPGLRRDRDEERQRVDEGRGSEDL